jgi:hypothetical protein
MKMFAWYRKADLIDLMLKIALVNCYAEGLASTLRKQKPKEKLFQRLKRCWTTLKPKTSMTPYRSPKLRLPNG